MSDELYRKNAKGKFELVGYEFTGFPSNGIWVVEDGRRNCIYPFKDAPEQPTPSLVSYMRYSNELQQHISNAWTDRERLSVMDIAEIACEFFALKAGGMKIKDEIIEG